MAKKKFKKLERDLLFIPALSQQELMPKGSLPYVIDRFVDSLDLDRLEGSYSGDGCHSYPPRALLKVILMAYCENVYGCRPIADKVKYDMRYGYMCGYRQPSFNTINRFRTHRLGLEGTEEIFGQLVSRLSKERLIDIEDIYVDGTTVESRASRKRLVWGASQRKYAEGNTRKVKELLEQVGAAQREDAQDAPDPDAPKGNGGGPAEGPHLSGEETAALRALAGTLPKSAKKAELEERLDKADRYRQADEMCGGRSGTAATDPDSVAMRPKEDVTRKGPHLPMYNAMAASSNQFLIHVGLFGLTNDTAAYPLFLRSLYSAFGDRLKSQTADAAFGSEVNVLLSEGLGLEPYFKHTMYDKEHQAGYKPDPFQPQNFRSNDDGTLTCPSGRTFRKTGESTRTKHGITQTETHYRCESCRYCRLKRQCLTNNRKQPREVRINHRWWKDTKPRLDRRLDSEQGQEKLHSRAFNIEPCFAHIKWAGNYKRFRHFGAKLCLMDLNIKALAVNLKKYANKAKRNGFCRVFEVKISLNRRLLAA